MQPLYHKINLIAISLKHGLRTPREEIVFTARPKIHSQSQILGTVEAYFGPIFQICIFDLCLHWVSVVRGLSEGIDFETLQ